MKPFTSTNIQAGRISETNSPFHEHDSGSDDILKRTARFFDCLLHNLDTIFVIDAYRFAVWADCSHTGYSYLASTIILISKASAFGWGKGTPLSPKSPLSYMRAKTRTWDALAQGFALASGPAMLQSSTPKGRRPASGRSPSYLGTRSSLIRTVSLLSVQIKFYSVRKHQSKNHKIIWLNIWAFGNI